MHDERILKLDAEISELETWLKEHPNHLPEDKVEVRMNIYRKELLRQQIITEQLNELVNKENHKS